MYLVYSLIKNRLLDLSKLGASYYLGATVPIVALCNSSTGDRSPRWSSGHRRMLLALFLEFESHRGEIF